MSIQSMSKVEWAAFTFPALNLLNVPKHQVLLDYITNYYYENLLDLWDTETTRDVLKEQIVSGWIEINLQGMYKQEAIR